MKRDFPKCKLASRKPLWMAMSRQDRISLKNQWKINEIARSGNGPLDDHFVEKPMENQRNYQYRIPQPASNFVEKPLVNQRNEQNCKCLKCVEFRWKTVSTSTKWGILTYKLQMVDFVEKPLVHQRNEEFWQINGKLWISLKNQWEINEIASPKRRQWRRQFDGKPLGISTKWQNRGGGQCWPRVGPISLKNR